MKVKIDEVLSSVNIIGSGIFWLSNEDCASVLSLSVPLKFEILQGCVRAFFEIADLLTLRLGLDIQNLMQMCAKHYECLHI